MEYTCPKCGSTRIVRVATYELTQRVSPDEEDGTFEVGDLVDSQEQKVKHFKCNSCNFTSSDISKFPVRDET